MRKSFLFTVLLLVAIILLYNNLQKRVFPEVAEEITAEEIISLTNNERLEQGLVLFSENNLLSQAALVKIEDMITNQYFAHESPLGKEAGDLVNAVGYQYIAIGENLAKGDFSDAQEIVKGWMESPPHRENIVHPGYREIGVAVKKSNHVWFAVQIFGLSVSACPTSDDSLLEKIDLIQKEIDSLGQKIKNLKNDIDGFYPRDNSKINQHNKLVSEYNKKVRESDSLVVEYNQQVSLTNKCIEEYGF
jgi:hypothetical protein